MDTQLTLSVPMLVGPVPVAPAPSIEAIVAATDDVEISVAVKADIADETTAPDVPAEATACALPALDQILKALMDERIERLTALRTENADKVSQVKAAYQAVVERVVAAQAARTAEVEAARAEVEQAETALKVTIEKVDLVRLYAAESTSAAADQADAVADAAVNAANENFRAAKERLNEIVATDESAKKNENDKLDLAKITRDEALSALADELAVSEKDYQDAVEEIARREAAEAERQAERNRRDAERQTAAGRLIVEAQTAKNENRLQAILDEARAEKVLHVVEKHITARRRDLAAAFKGAVAFARTFPVSQLPAGDVLALVTAGAVDVFCADDSGDWQPWQSWAGIGNGKAREVATPRNKRHFTKREVFALAARKSGKVIPLRKNGAPDAPAN